MLDIIFLTAQHMQATFGVTAIVAGVVAIGAMSTQVAMANKDKKDAKEEQDLRQEEIDALKAARKEIPDYSAQYEQLAGEVENPYANLSVATEAAQFQAEQADQALANTLDTMLATGAGAGGATALARAALESKKGISASLQQQEATNQNLKAQGAQAAQTQRLQLKEGAIKAEQYEQAINEDRINMDLDRAAGLQDRAAAEEMAARAAQIQAVGNIASTAGSVSTTAAGQI